MANWVSAGCGVIANELAQAMEKRGKKLYGVVNRTQEKAVAFAEKYGVQNVFTSFEEVCADPAVDIIYISTPHNTHIQFLRKALAAGKHVLCEKSITLNSGELEEAMQKVMDQYAGGIGTHYQFNEKQLAMAEEKIKKLQILAKGLAAADMHELMFIYELKERLTVCLTVIAHLRARKETRWHSFAENLDYPEKSDAWLCYVNSKKNGDQITMIRRDLVKGGETYEHRD